MFKEFLKILAGIAAIFGAINIETPKYDIIQKYDNFEIRDYPSIVIAEV